jgi:hypothetical protein
LSDRKDQGLRRMLGILSLALGILGLWILVFLSFFPGMFIVIFGVLVFLTSIGLIGRGNGHTISFWAFDRNEKGKWEDVDRIIRR